MIGVREVLRRIIGKTISTFLKEEIKLAAGPLQVCVGHSAGAEATIHINTPWLRVLMMIVQTESC